MKHSARSVIVFLLVIILLMLSACSASSRPSPNNSEYVRGYNEGFDDGYKSGYYDGFDSGYAEQPDDASPALDYSVDAMRNSITNIASSLDYALRILDHPEDYSLDDLYAAIEDARSFCYDYE